MAHRIRSFITTALVIALGTVALGGPAEAADAPRPSQAGRWLLDPDGRVLVLHGVNMVNKTGNHEPGATGFGADDAAFLAEQGFTTVRLGLIWKAVEPSPGEYDDAYLESVRETTELLAAEGIWTLLDFHQDLYNERFQGEGAPDWAVQDDGLPAQPAARLPVQLLRRCPRSGGPSTTSGRTTPDRAVSACRIATRPRGRHVAEYFSSTPGVMGYDLFNEPWPGTGYAICMNPRRLPRLRQEAERLLPAGHRRHQDGRPGHGQLLRAQRAVQQRCPHVGEGRRRQPRVLVPRLLPLRRRPRPRVLSGWIVRCASSSTGSSGRTWSGTSASAT